jgi:hypothetical protein
VLRAIHLAESWTPEQAREWWSAHLAKDEFVAACLASEPPARRTTGDPPAPVSRSVFAIVKGHLVFVHEAQAVNLKAYGLV